MKKRKIPITGRITVWIAALTTLFTVEAVIIYILIDICSQFFRTGGLYTSPVRSLWVLIPTVLFVGVVTYFANRRAHRYLDALTRGLRAVAGGDFSIRLEVPDAVPLASAFEDFNQMARDLQSVQTLREDFIDNFSHEFKTPITAISGFAELLQEPGITPEEEKQYLQVISEEARRLADLANSSLLISKLDSQRSIVEKKTYSLDEQIKRCTILLSPTWEKKRIAFSADLQPADYFGNEELMRHVWLNLLNNAIKYTPEGGEVSISLKTTPKELTVAVSDTGIGMSPEVQAHMFDRYYQGAPNHTEKGLGLGLSIVHRIVELCGGSIRVESVEDQGSTFTVVLPRTDA